MRIVDVRERSVAISRYRDAGIPSRGLTTSAVAVITEVNPLSLAPFGGLADGSAPAGGRAKPPPAAGIGFEGKADLFRLFTTVLGT